MDRGQDDKKNRSGTGQSHQISDREEHVNAGPKKKSNTAYSGREGKPEVQNTSRGYRHTGNSGFGETISTSRGGTYTEENSGSASRGRSSHD